MALSLPPPNLLTLQSSPRGWGQLLRFIAAFLGFFLVSSSDCLNSFFDSFIMKTKDPGGTQISAVSVVTLWRLPLLYSNSTGKGGVSWVQEGGSQSC